MDEEWDDVFVIELPDVKPSRPRRWWLYISAYTRFYSWYWWNRLRAAR